MCPIDKQAWGCNYYQVSRRGNNRVILPLPNLKQVAAVSTVSAGLFEFGESLSTFFIQTSSHENIKSI
jgi:hypothetical protein